MAGINSRVKDIRGMRPFAYGKSDRIFSVGLSPSVISLVKFKRDMGLYDHQRYYRVSDEMYELHSQAPGCGDWRSVVLRGVQD